MRKDFERARESCDRACSLSRDVSGGRWTGEILKHYGAIYHSTGRLELALDSLAQARRVADNEKDTLLAAETARELAEVYRKQGRNQDTLKALNESFRLFSDFNAKHNLAEVRERALDSSTVSWTWSVRGGSRSSQRTTTPKDTVSASLTTPAPWLLPRGWIRSA